eukprot:Transcript_32421.p1 GENE.Transcript_32421~~Transcript_32421.p1  ORF type:complete len:534 (-),score=90.95 Transcript_32421:346-1890(-)
MPRRQRSGASSSGPEPAPQPAPDQPAPHRKTAISKSLADCAKALQTEGFALISLHNAYTQQMAVAGERRFALQPATKLGLARAAEDGYVRCPHKELFHFGPGSDAVRSGRHVRTAAAAFRDDACRAGQEILCEINDSVLPPPEGAMPKAAVSWYGYERYTYTHGKPSVDVGASIVTDFCYLASNPEPMHSAAHVDKGLLTICYNPADIEICLNGEWITPCKPGQGKVALVMVGFTLERASAGVFQAALHRVRNRGLRRALVAKIRAPPDTSVHPRLITSQVDPRLVVGDLEPFTVGELQQNFEAAHSSVNAPTAAHLAGAILHTPQPTHGLLSLPVEMLLSIVGGLAARELASLRPICRLLRELASLEQLWVPLAERSHIDWNLALDRIDLRSPSVGRRTQHEATPYTTPQLLAQVRPRWHAIVCSEAFDDEMFLRSQLSVTVVTQDGNEVCFSILMRTRLQKMMLAFCNRQGCSMNAVRFLFDGNRINETQTPSQLEFENDEVVDVMVEQMGD